MTSQSSAKRSRVLGAIDCHDYPATTFHCNCFGYFRYFFGSNFCFSQVWKRAALLNIVSVAGQNDPVTRIVGQALDIDDNVEHRSNHSYPVDKSAGKPLNSQS